VAKNGSVYTKTIFTMDLTDYIECGMCRAYVYDTIARPLSVKDCVIFGPLINTKRAMRRAMVFIPEFVRATFSDKNHEYLAILFVEAGGVAVSKCFNQNSVLPIARMWVRNRLTELGDLDQLHYFHTCASPPPDAIVAPNSAHGLRIRIPPPKCDDLYD
jgi:hypothetical protein